MFKIAVVQAAPVWMDRVATVSKTAHLVREAGANGADVVAFGESFIPGYPWWLVCDDLRVQATPVVSARQAWYLREAVSIERGDLDPVAEAARATGAFVAVGVAELAPTGGSIYCSLVMIDPDLGVVGVHRKLKPTHVERVAWSDGDGHGLRVHQFGDWKIGGLSCWENWLPVPRFTLYSQGEQLHIATWPGFTRATASGITSFVAEEGGMFVASVCGLFNSELIPDDFPDAGGLSDSVLTSMGDGGSVICGPDGAVLATATKHREEIVYADVDLESISAARMMRDQGGHYHRPDVFDLTIDRTRHHPATYVD